MNCAIFAPYINTMKKQTSLNDLQDLRSLFGLGPAEPQKESEESDIKATAENKDIVRIHLQRLKGNREATVIKGLSLKESALVDMANTLKKSCGVGGSAKDHEIILQGNHRDKVMKWLIAQGYKNTKLAGG